MGRIGEIQQAKCWLMKFGTLTKIKTLVRTVKVFHLVPANNRGKS